MVEMTHEQDKLLKQLHDMDQMERAGIIPERQKINIFLLGLISVLASFFIILAVIDREWEIVPLVLVSTAFITIPFIAAIKNKKWGYYMLAISAWALSLHVAYTEPNYYSPLVSFCDGLFLLIITNQLGQKAYIGFGIFYIVKNLAIFALFNRDQNTGYFLTSLVNILALGSIPLMITFIFNSSRRLKKSEIRANLLALQNQDLLNSWVKDYTGHQNIPMTESEQAPAEVKA